VDVVDVTERLMSEFERQLGRDLITRVVTQCRHDLHGAPTGALPELLERAARQRLLTLLNSPPLKTRTHRTWLSALTSCSDPRGGAGRGGAGPRHAVSVSTSWSGSFAGGRAARSCQGREKLVGERTPSCAPPAAPVFAECAGQGNGQGWRAWSGGRSGRRRLWDFWVTCAGCRAGRRPSGWGGAGAVRVLQHAANRLEQIERLIGDVGHSPARRIVIELGLYAHRLLTARRMSELAAPRPGRRHRPAVLT
jgi:hypothetical protein